MRKEGALTRERIEALERHGVDTSALAVLVLVHEDAAGRWHGSDRCSEATEKTAKEVVARDVEDGCACLLSVLSPGAHRLVSASRVLSSIEAVLDAGGGGGVQDIHVLDRLTHLRTQAELLEAPGADAVREDVLARVQARIEELRSRLRSEAHRETLVLEAAGEALENCRSRVLTDEDARGLLGPGGEWSRELERRLQEAYTENLVRGREAAKRSLEEEAAALGQEQGPEREGGREEARDVAARLSAHWEKELERVVRNGQEALVAYRSSEDTTPQTRETIVSYLVHEAREHRVVRAPLVVAEQLRRRGDQGREVARLRAGDTEETVEIAVGLYDPESTALSTLEAALQAARSCTPSDRRTAAPQTSVLQGETERPDGEAGRGGRRRSA